MPTPVILVVVLLVGWPLVQLASVLAVRGRRRRLKALAFELKADGRYGPDDLALVDREIGGSRGEPFSVVAPVSLPFAILGAALSELVGRDRPSGRGSRDDQHRRAESIEARLTELAIALGRRTGRETVTQDPRLHEMSSLATEIGFLRWPTTAVLTVLTCLPILPLYLLAYGVREAAAVVPQATVALGRSIRMVMLGLHGRLGRTA